MLLFSQIGAVLMSSANCQADKADAPDLRVRRPAVAGQFYTGSPGGLRREVESYLEEGTALDSPARMIISPHAGHIFSGALAGKAFATIDRSVKTVVLMGPSHRAMFTGVSIADVDAYETPLGTVLLDAGMVTQLRSSPLVVSEPQAHAAEHCLEVQLPFIQVALPGARVVPIIMGRVDAGDVADLIEPLLDDSVLLVASSDLSHFHTHKEAKKIDAASVTTILEGDTDGFIDGCGEQPIRVLMTIAERRGLKPVLLDARNSHETAPAQCPPGRVVGYAAVAYVSETDEGTAEAARAGGEDGIPDDTRTYLLKLARASLDAAVKGGKEPSVADAPAFTREKRGCFVTLTVNGQLRGCIGYIEPIKPLCDAVVDNARNAALKDPRFPAVSARELESIRVEVSVLTRPKPLAFDGPDDLLDKLVPGRDGVILQKGFHQSTFLPQVWDQLPDKVQFLQRLSVKGGMAADGWKDASVKTYRAIHFEEH